MDTKEINDLIERYSERTRRGWSDADIESIRLDAETELRRGTSTDMALGKALLRADVDSCRQFAGQITGMWHAAGIPVNGSRAMAAGVDCAIEQIARFLRSRFAPSLFRRMVAWLRKTPIARGRSEHEYQYALCDLLGDIEREAPQVIH